jgi:hypothetical protein
MSTVVLDIGADTGALVLYTPAGLDEREIEISRGAGPRTHSQVHKRLIRTGHCFAAVYPSLAAGEYVIWRDQDAAAMMVTITGGTVTSCQWPG